MHTPSVATPDHSFEPPSRQLLWPPHRASAAPAAPPQLQISWARHGDDLRQVRGLRRRLLARQLGAPPGMPAVREVDSFDGHGEHLLLHRPATDSQPARLVATCRLLTPAGALRAGGLQAQTLFDLSRLSGLRSRIIEVGHCVIDPAWQGAGLVRALRSALTDFMLHNDLDIGLGCVSLTLHDGGHQAASLWRRLQAGHAASAQLAAIPRLPLPIDALREDPRATPPALLQGLLHCGARLLGPPAWNAGAGTAELPMLLQLAYLPAAYRRHGLAR